VFHDIKQSLSDLRSEIAKVKSTDWQPIGIIVSLASFILGGFGTVVAWGLMSNLSKTEDRVESLETATVSVMSNRYTRTDADAKSSYDHGEVRRLENLISAVKRELDETLQREMRLLDNKGAADLSALQDRIVQVEGAMLGREEWMSNHDPERLSHQRTSGR